MPDPRPATPDEIIDGYAEMFGVPSALARAVAQRESGANPNVQPGDGGKAIGMFQLHEGAAIDTGVQDRSNPSQNIMGGVKYLKQLSDRYKGDVSKTLMAYNGGMANVDAGTVSPEAQAYATAIISQMTRGAASPAPAAPPAAQAPAIAPIKPMPSHSSPTLLQSMAEGVDPRRREGRQNIAGMAGAVAGGILAAPTAAVSGPFGPATGALLGSMVGGGLQEGGEQFLEWLHGTKPDVAAVGKATATQGAYEAGGHVLMWPLTRVGQSLIASRVGRQASEALTRGVESARTTGRAAVQGARESLATGVATAKDAAREALESTRESGRSFLDTVRNVGVEKVQQAGTTGQGAIEAVKAANAERLAAADLEALDIVRQAEEPYRRALQRAPSREALTSSTRDVVAGLPGLQGAGEGPAKRALDVVGKRIDEVAAQGPMVKATPLQDALRDMVKEAEPPSFFPAQSQARNIGFQFGGGAAPAVSSAPAARLKPSAAEIAQFQQKIAAKLGVSEQHPLPGILGKMYNAPEEVSFADMHQFKRLLDEGVNWDKVAKKHLESITKGLRVKVRQVLGVYEPYNEANAAYQAVVPLYRKGAGKQVISAAAERPDRLATVLKANNPTDAEAVRRLLVEQSEKGGDPKVGQQAWDAVRATYTYDNIIAGGVKGLEQRITKLTTEHPEFAQVVYGDPTAKQVLNNLQRIGTAYRMAVEQGPERVAAVKAGNEATLEATKGVADRSVGTATQDARSSVIAARQKVAESIRARRLAGRQDVEAATTAGTERLRTTREGASQAVKGAQEDVSKFKGSSMGRYATRTLESQGADVLRAVGLGPKTIWGALSVIRLLESPKGSDLIQAAAHSDAFTRGVVKILTSSGPGTANAALLRELVAVANSPTRSGKSEAAAR